MSTSKEYIKIIRQNQPNSLDLYDIKKYPSTQFQYKNEDESDQIQNTCPTQNLVMDESTMFNQQKKRCVICSQTQKRLQIVEYNLQCQKKKNAKYLKIMNKRIEKQKELQQTYYQIAKELKKKIVTFNNGKQKQHGIQLGSTIKQQNIVLNEESRKQVEYKHLLLISKNIDLQLQLKKFYCFKIIHFQIINEVIVDQDQAQVQNFLLNKQQSINSGQKLSYLKQQSVSFYSINNNAISKSFQQFAHAKQHNSAQIQQGEYKKQSSYYSISQQLSINEISNVLIKNSMSNQERECNIQKQFLKQLSPQVSQNVVQNMLQYSFKQNKKELNNKIKQIEQERVKIINFVVKIKSLLNNINKQLNIYGEKYKIFYPLPSAISIQPNLLASNQFHIQDILIPSQNLEQIQKQLIQQLYQILKCYKKQYEKMLNDKQLSIYGLKTKISDLQNDKIRYDKIIEKYQVHKAMLSIKILDLQQQLKRAKKQTSNNQQYKLMFNNAQIECDIDYQEWIKINQNLQNNNRKLANALNYIPVLLNKINSHKEIQQQVRMNLQNNLQEQLQQLFRNSYKSLYISQNNHNIKRTESIIENSLISNNLRRASEKQKLMDILLKENQQLKDLLKNKAQQLLKYNEKITLQKMEMAVLDKNIQNLNVKIAHLTVLLQQKNINHLPLKQNMNVGQSTADKQFAEYIEKKQYNNLYWDRDNELKELKLKLQTYQAQIIKLRQLTTKNKKIVYIAK